MRESVIEERVCKHAKTRGWLVRKVAYLGRRGAPDRWFFKDGQIVIVEFKRPGEPLAIHQSREKRRLEDKGITVHVIDNEQDGYALF